MFLEAYPEAVVEAKVEVTELMGPETFLYLDVNGVSLTARVDPRTRAKAGDVIKIGFDINKLHMFDKETEMTILNRTISEEAVISAF